MPVLPVVDAGPEFPELLDYLWRWFQEISIGLAPNGFAPPVVTWEALRAWQAATRVGEIEPWEARTLVQLGMLRAGIQSEKNDAANRASNTNGTQPPARFGGATMTPRGAMTLPRRR